MTVVDCVPKTHKRRDTHATIIANIDPWKADVSPSRRRALSPPSVRSFDRSVTTTIAVFESSETIKSTPTGINTEVFPNYCHECKRTGNFTVLCVARSGRDAGTGSAVIPGRRVVAISALSSAATRFRARPESRPATVDCTVAIRVT